MEKTSKNFDRLSEVASALAVVEGLSNKSLGDILSFVSAAMKDGRLVAEKDTVATFALIDAADNMMSAEREYLAMYNTFRSMRLAADEKAAKGSPIFQHADSAMVLSGIEPSEEEDMYTYIVRKAWGASQLEDALLYIAPKMFPDVIGTAVVDDAKRARAEADKKESAVERAKAAKGSSYSIAYAAALMKYIDAVQKIIDSIATIITSDSK